MKQKWFLGYLKGTKRRIYLYDFEWSCGWYWAGGYVGNSDLHCHFDGCFLNTPDSRGHSLGNFFDPWTKLPTYLEEKNIIRITNGASIWEPLSTFLDNAQYSEREWWRIKDLFKQFYALKQAAETLQYGGHCTSYNRTNVEIQPELATTINEHIKTVIIPAIHVAIIPRDIPEHPRKASIKATIIGTKEQI